MRPVAIFAACAVAVLGIPPVVAYAQSTTTTTTTTRNDAATIWEKIKGSWTQTKGAVKEQWGKLTDDDLMEIPRGAWPRHRGAGPEWPARHRYADREGLVTRDHPFERPEVGADGSGRRQGVRSA